MMIQEKHMTDPFIVASQPEALFARALERRAFKLNRFAALSLSGRIAFCAKPVSPFARDALATPEHALPAFERLLSRSSQI